MTGKTPHPTSEVGPARCSSAALITPGLCNRVRTRVRTRVTLFPLQCRCFHYVHCIHSTVERAFLLSSRSESANGQNGQKSQESCKSFLLLLLPAPAAATAESGPCEPGEGSMIDRADRSSVDRNPDTQAPPSTIASSKVAKLSTLPHPPADQSGTYAYQSVSLPRYGEMDSHCPPLLKPAPHLCANPLSACLCLSLAPPSPADRLHSANAISAAPEPPKQSGVHCIAAQILDPGPERPHASRPCRAPPAELAITSLDLCRATIPRSTFYPAQLNPGRSTIACMQHGAQSGRILLPLQYGGTAARLDVSVA